MNGRLLLSPNSSIAVWATMGPLYAKIECMCTCMCNWVSMLYSRKKRLYWGNNYFKNSNNFLKMKEKKGIVSGCRVACVRWSHLCVRKIALIAIQTDWRWARLEALGSLLQMSREEKMGAQAKDKTEGSQRRGTLTNSKNTGLSQKRKGSASSQRAFLIGRLQIKRSSSISWREQRARIRRLWPDSRVPKQVMATQRQGS